MKKHLIVIVVIVVLAATACQETVDFEAEKEAIVAVIQDEKEGYLAMDMEQLSRNVLQDSTYFFMYSAANNFYVNHGFTDQADQIKEGWENRDTLVTDRDFEFKVKEMKIFPQCAWTVIKVKWHFVYEGEDYDTFGVEALFLEKIDGEWKISGQTVVGASSYEEEDEEGDEDKEAEEGDEETEEGEEEAETEDTE